ncbi:MULTISPECIES: DoxX family protein [unclassified Streptomyces]|uniref:DoxX family protein n=1 Tax=unclassified Streptomyces TaxID=2593676 RepID=UPI0006AE78EB|nr:MULTISPECIES: DoxX family protein [unclassified Streptomyces]KOX28601.1 DoxX family protein [Streptomyces sp. NRRL F-6491]KOX41889.1 DoxX family protein [Streptomyces sp. NRRL F-6492]
MSLLRIVGRPMLASMFIAGGVSSLRDPQRVVPVAESVVRPVTERISVLPDDTKQVVRLTGAVQVVSGVLLGLGRCPRLSALALAATLVPTTLAAHRYWEVEDPSDRAQQRIHFLKNVSMLGGLLITADDTGSAPSVLWRGRHAAQDLRHDARLVRRSVRATAPPAAAIGSGRAKLGI